MILAYHRASGLQRSSNRVEMLDAHFEHIASNYSVVLPGEKVASHKLSVCLTFDDAYFDFYHLIYPLLKKHRLRAILAIPTKYIKESSSQNASKRLEALTQFWCFRKEQPSGEIFCTFDELRAMRDCVTFASHTHSHPDLTETTDLQRELLRSKETIEQQLGCVNTIIYPYGRVNRTVQKQASKLYKYQMRLGSALNWGWDQQMLYRITGDGLQNADEPFGALALASPFLKLLSKKFLLPHFQR